MRVPRRLFALPRRAAAVAVGALAVTAVLQPTAANAYATSITGYHVVSVTYSSFSVSVASLGPGWSYRLYASTTKSKVYYANLSTAPHSALSSTPTTKMTSLAYTTAPYWYRVVGTKGTSRRTGPIASIGLRPTAPTSFAITNTTGRLPQLHWSSVTTTGFQIQQATNSTFTTGLRTYTTRDNLHRFTPYLVSNGSLYYYRVRGVNNGTKSAYSPVVGSRAKASEKSVKVMTYNILTNVSDGSHEGDFDIAKWSTDRRDGAARLILQGAPDLVSIQEGSSFSPNPSACCTRMVDDLVNELNALGGTYALARTEIPPPDLHYFRTGDYIIYNTSTMRTVGTGDHIDLGNDPSGKPWWAAYQAVANVATGAQMLFVATHLAVGGASVDTTRYNQTKSMLSQIASLNTGGLPVVYAGDFNSHPAAGHTDWPGILMFRAGASTAEHVAQSLTNAKYDSANQYLANPPAFGDNIDHVFVPQGEGVVSWKLLINLSSGKLVMPIPSDHNPLVTSVAVPY